MIIDEIEQIHLEMNENAPIQFIKKIVISSNGDLVIMDKDRIHQYSDNGEFIRNIASKGRTVKEYISLTDICIDQDRVMILDDMCRVVIYDLNTGQHIETIKPTVDGKPFRVDNIVASRDGGFMIISCCMDNKSVIKPTPAIYEFDSNGEFLCSHIEINEAMITMSLSSQSYDNSYLIRPLDSQNIIHRVKDGVITPRYYVDFEGQGVGPGAIYGSDGSIDLRGFFGSTKYKYPSMIQESDENISLLVAGPEFSAQTFLFGKKSKSAHKFVAADGRTTPTNPIVSDSKYMYYIYNKYDDKGLSERADPLTKYFVEKFGFLKEDDNPSIIKVKFDI